MVKKTITAPCLAGSTKLTREVIKAALVQRPVTDLEELMALHQASIKELNRLQAAIQAAIDEKGRPPVVPQPLFRHGKVRGMSEFTEAELFDIKKRHGVA